MVDARRIFGTSAEETAAEYLIGKGFTILDKQFRTQFGEIDLVAREGNEIVFVEVKARQGSEFGYPEESVTRRKVGKIAAAGEMYLRAHAPHATHRIDVVAIVYTNDVPEILHIPGVG